MGQSCNGCSREPEKPIKAGEAGSCSQDDKEFCRDVDARLPADSSYPAAKHINGGCACTHPEKGVYDGDLVDGFKHGAGVLCLPDGGRYEGQFRLDKKTGKGTFVSASAISTYTGEWEDNCQHGHGEERWSNGSTFVGQYRQGAKHGHGSFSWATQCSYEGEFDQDEMHGVGTYKWRDGRGYCGLWTRNCMGPKGRMWWPDGREYHGDFTDGRKHGQGIMTWPDGACYSGPWAEGLQHGEGVWSSKGCPGRRSSWNDGVFVKFVDNIENCEGDRLNSSSALLADRTCSNPALLHTPGTSDPNRSKIAVKHATVGVGAPKRSKLIRCTSCWCCLPLGCWRK